MITTTDQSSTTKRDSKGRRVVNGRHFRDTDVQRWYEWYVSGHNFNAVARMAGCMKGKKPGSVVRQAFVKRGLPLISRPNTGCFQRGPVYSFEQIREIIAAEVDGRMAVPVKLRQHWRQLDLDGRRAFVQIMKDSSGWADPRPQTAYSANVIPFEFGTPAAHQIAAALNAGRPSRRLAVQITPPSVGVIYEGELWHWTGKCNGYQQTRFLRNKARPMLHRHIYEQAHGVELDGNTVIRFVDGNANNLDPANLYAEHRESMLRTNQAGSLRRKGARKMELLLSKDTRLIDTGHKI
jgi:hypothetical protein